MGLENIILHSKLFPDIIINYIVDNPFQIGFQTCATYFFSHLKQTLDNKYMLPN